MKKLASLMLFLCALASGFAQADLSQQRSNVSSNQGVPIRVSVVGKVIHPGVYTVTTNSRLSEVIELASYLTDTEKAQLAEKNIIEQDSVYIKTVLLREKEYSTRNIILLRKNEKRKIDLEKFLALGDEQQNPYLMDGDVIQVPAALKYVFIDGAVNRPGQYELSPGDRITDILTLAFGVREDAFLKKAEVIRFVMDIDSTKVIDINLKEVLTNDKYSDNIILEKDDRIFVRSKPEYRKIRNLYVDIYGEIQNPGKYKVIEGYRLSDLITLAGDLTNGAYMLKAEIARQNRYKKQTMFINVDLNTIVENPKSEENYNLQDGDRVYIRTIPKYSDFKTCQIKGSINFPGDYAIIENVTTLLEILEKAGGPLPEADLKNSYFARKSSEDISDFEFERLKTMKVEEMSTLEYEYFKAKLREREGKFAMDIEKLWTTKDKKYDVVLKDGDYVYIPTTITTVTVRGQVKNPGLVPFQPGENYRYYINKCGGYALNARKWKIRLIRGNTGEWLKPHDDTKIERGDMIFIPETKDFDYWELTKDIVRVLGELATIIVVINSVTQ